MQYALREELRSETLPQTPSEELLQLPSPHAAKDRHFFRVRVREQQSGKTLADLKDVSDLFYRKHTLYT